MKTTSLLILFFPLVFSAQRVLSSGGNAPASVTQKTISFTLGEPITTTAINNNTDQKITQGFHQPIKKIDEEIVVENAFSPNGDGVNDTWVFKSEENNKKYDIVIFSRWGNIIWENKKDYTLFEWNGKNLNDEDVPDGTYYYSLTLNDKTIANGFVEITR